MTVILFLVAAYVSSWIVTCGIIKLITLCFGLTFKWNIATGVWLLILLLKSTFKIKVTERR